MNVYYSCSIQEENYLAFLAENINSRLEMCISNVVFYPICLPFSLPPTVYFSIFPRDFLQNASRK